MNFFTKSCLQSNIIKFVFAALFLLGLYRGGEYCSEIFRALPISGMKPTNPQQTVVDDNFLKNLYPLVADEPNKPKSSAPSEIVSVDDAFIPKVVLAPPPPAYRAPDYFPALQANHILELQATTNSGAIINKHYYAYGELLNEYAYPANGKQVTPILKQSTKSYAVEITENPGKRHFTLTLN